MRFDEVLSALRGGKSIQRSSQPVQWARLKRSPNGAFHWYGYGEAGGASPLNLTSEDLDAEDWVVVDDAVALARQPQPTHSCRRRGEQGRAGELQDHWNVKRGHRACSYCGSLHPNDLMARLELGNVELEPTDKHYMAYVAGEGLHHAKFHFQHLSDDQQQRFVDLLNEKRIRVGFPGYFYTKPFFIA